MAVENCKTNIQTQNSTLIKYNMTYLVAGASFVKFSSSLVAGDGNSLNPESPALNISQLAILLRPVSSLAIGTIFEKNSKLEIETKS